MTMTKPASDSEAGAVQASPRQDPPAWRYKLRRLDEKGSPYLYISPFFILFFAFGIFPIVITLWISLHNWSINPSVPSEWVGGQNFETLWADYRFWNAVRNTLSIFLLSTIPQLLMALGLAHVLNTRIRARTFFRMGVLLPNVTSVAAVALVFNQLFARDYGVVNVLLEKIPLLGHDANTHWIVGKKNSHIMLATMVTWRWTGYNALIYLAAMQAIPKELYEAASMDGASSFRQFWQITIPMLRPTIIFTVIISTIGGFQLFTEPLLMDANPTRANGGALREFQTLALFMYQQGIVERRYGYGAAIAWAMFVIIVIVAIFNYLLTRRISTTK